MLGRCTNKREDHDQRFVKDTPNHIGCQLGKVIVQQPESKVGGWAVIIS